MQRFFFFNNISYAALKLLPSQLQQFGFFSVFMLCLTFHCLVSNCVSFTMARLLSCAVWWDAPYVSGWVTSAPLCAPSILTLVQLFPSCDGESRPVVLCLLYCVSDHAAVTASPKPPSRDLGGWATPRSTEECGRTVVREWTTLPIPELLEMASCRRSLLNRPSWTSSIYQSSARCTKKKKKEKERLGQYNSNNS